MNRGRSRRRGYYFWRGADIVAHDAMWDLVYEDVARMMEDPEARDELRKAAIRLYECIVKILRKLRRVKK